IDRTVTAGGARLLASRLARPLLDVAAIDQRLDAVDWFVEHRQLRQRLREVLKGAGDMARALSRLALGRGGPRDLGCIRDTLKVGERLAGMAGGSPDPLSPPPFELEHVFKALTPSLHEGLSQFLAILEQGLGPDLPALARDGGFVASGVRPELDQARTLRDDSRKVIAAMESQLALESGVPLKIRHNGVLGYFVEATAGKADPLFQPPLNATFIHRQTLANQVRFTTVELADLDARIAQAAERALAMEVAAFEDWREQARMLADAIQIASEALARLDVASSLAEWAEDAGAVRPVVDTSYAFDAKGARHPVVEAAVKRAGDPYTPNDCCLDASGETGARLSIVTGPNMAGKSTFLRQNALLAILAQ
ncbi:MAG: DNA mismatch repair protein MutS, partial [Caulobacter vibrioides]